MKLHMIYYEKVPLPPLFVVLKGQWDELPPLSGVSGCSYSDN